MPGKTVNTFLCFPLWGLFSQYLLDNNIKLFEMIHLKVLQFTDSLTEQKAGCATLCFVISESSAGRMSATLPGCHWKCLGSRAAGSHHATRKHEGLAWVRIFKATYGNNSGNNCSFLNSDNLFFPCFGINGGGGGYGDDCLGFLSKYLL